MKHTAILAFLLATLSSPAADVVAYSEKSGEQLRIASAVNETNELTRTGAVSSFPASFTGHRSVCTVASTNAPYVAWIGGSAYALGNPYGCSSGRDYAAVELTDRSEITPRISLLTQKADREYTVSELYADITNRVYDLDLSAKATSNQLASLNWMYTENMSSPTAKCGDAVRVRVVRWLVDDMPVWRVVVSPRAVVDRQVILDESAFLTEADVISDTAPDIDWETITNEVVANQAVLDERLPVRNMYYLVVLGEGKVAWSNSSDTATVRALPFVIHRDFGSSAPTARAVPFSASVPLARPTFRFACDGTDTRTATAFELKIVSGGTVSWSSGIRRIPPRDLNGNYVYPAPSLAGTLSAGSYTWQIRLLNSRWRDSPWSASSDVTFE